MENTCTIRFMGDVMIGRNVNLKISESGYEYPWGDVLPLLRQEGVNIINLEAAITTSKRPVNKVFNFKADPDKINTLKVANIHVANIANNHIGDYGIDGLEETIRILDHHSIGHAGAGINIAQAKKPIIIKENNIKIGIIGCTDNEPSWRANLHPGTFFITVDDPEELESEVVKLRSEVDVLIISIHWGPNMEIEPNKRQIEFAHRLIDLGVDIIHGHSAHIFQGIEIYKGKIILYDTGDFIDDYVVNELLRNDRSFLFECIIKNKKLSEFKLRPVIIQNMQVCLAIGHNKEYAIARMQYLSSVFGTRITDEGEVVL
ncbi:CapA family protein [Sporocytophaga myxococcoides]|uniref:CapA family protein n=1 Tax=Sporocytophaga myxococcoides TaxID=153721 RepID=UPI0003FAA345|nr:CapA family protein [Sporocytophaga myxococcoides]